jgi:natural product precursor
MDNKEMEKNELNLKEMEQVAGGGQYADSDWARCWLGCKGPTFTSKTVNGHYYRG